MIAYSLDYQILLSQEKILTSLGMPHRCWSSAAVRVGGCIDTNIENNMESTRMALNRLAADPCFERDMWLHLFQESRNSKGPTKGSKTC